MNPDKFTKVIISGILICLIVIAHRLDSIDFRPEAPNVDVRNENNGGKIVQIAPNIIGVVDTGFRTGWEQLIVFEYNPDSKEFQFVSSLPYEDILNNPALYNIPTREDKYSK